MFHALADAYRESSGWQIESILHRNIWSASGQKDSSYLYSIRRRIYLIKMDASKKTGTSDSRAVYTPPCVVRMNDLKEGAGSCTTQGSGDSDGCSTGNVAHGRGCGPGQSGSCTINYWVLFFLSDSILSHVNNWNSICSEILPRTGCRNFRLIFFPMNTRFFFDVLG
jgi:hypothetical protein